MVQEQDIVNTIAPLFEIPIDVELKRFFKKNKTYCIKTYVRYGNVYSVIEVCGTHPNDVVYNLVNKVISKHLRTSFPKHVAVSLTEIVMYYMMKNKTSIIKSVAKQIHDQIDQKFIDRFVKNESFALMRSYGVNKGMAVAESRKIIKAIQLKRILL